MSKYLITQALPVQQNVEDIQSANLYANHLFSVPIHSQFNYTNHQVPAECGEERGDA